MTHDILFYFSILLVLTTLIPFIRHDFWIFRVFEYPRLQKLVLNALLLAIAVYFYSDHLMGTVTVLALLLNLCYLSYLIFPFTIFGKQQIVSGTSGDSDRNVKLFIANVFQENRKSAEYLDVIDKCDPDLILLVETDRWWQNQMDVLGSKYPHQLKVPLSNTYGMLLYSRLELSRGEIKYLVESDIPSIETLVKLPGGEIIRLFCLHPEPPVPQENPRSTERDKEILLVAKKAKQSEEPVIVMGDLNDVAWSYTTELFGKVSGLLDPRRGRGFFNSFNAKYFFLRFPLDHVFCSAEFSLNAIKRMKSCGSDHFPMFLDLQYNPAAEQLNETLVASADDLEIAAEKISADTN